MKNYRINPDKKYVDTIILGLLKKDGNCPCRVIKDETTLCPCDDFIKNGNCKCNLFVPIKNISKNNDN